ncbi:MAG: type II toxin-antitoxin system RelE/ParE family toxin [Candidatus Rokubacteria bacterium]|nr:type II toxin-antitoxin system RelE/ParE family toxin [Candidatus Rokubacteria bacterium]
MPQARAMPLIGPRCYELRVRDAHAAWRIVYRLDPDAVVIADVFSKTTRVTPPDIVEMCRRRLRSYDRA